MSCASAPRTSDAAQVLRPAAPKAMKELGRRAHALSEVVGDDHDLAVLRGAARERHATLAPGELALLERLVARRRRRLQRRALAHGRRVYGRRPGEPKPLRASTASRTTTRTGTSWRAMTA
jgi:DNA-binding response OmpR family regulator